MAGESPKSPSLESHQVPHWTCCRDQYEINSFGIKNVWRDSSLTSHLVKEWQYDVHLTYPSASLIGRKIWL